MKISRRTMLAGSAAAVTAPVLATVLAHREPGRPAIRLAAAQTGAQTAASVSFSLQNNSLSDTVYAFVTGQALAFARAGLGIGAGKGPLDRGCVKLKVDAAGSTVYRGVASLRGWAQH